MVIENIEQYMAQHEKAYENINHFFKAELSKKIDLFVWKDREEAYDMLGGHWALPVRNERLLMLGINKLKDTKFVIYCVI